MFSIPKPTEKVMPNPDKLQSRGNQHPTHERLADVFHSDANNAP